LEERSEVGDAAHAAPVPCDKHVEIERGIGGEIHRIDHQHSAMCVHRAMAVFQDDYRLIIGSVRNDPFENISITAGWYCLQEVAASDVATVCDALGFQNVPRTCDDNRPIAQNTA